MRDTARAKTSRALKWLARLAKRCLLAGMSILLAAGAAEIGLRLAGCRRPRIVGDEVAREMTMAPNAEFVYRGYLPGSFSDVENKVRLNSSGFHDVEHQPGRAATNTFRLLVVGDSYVAALSVPLEQTFFRRLERRLREEDPLSRGSYEVIAMGRGNQAQQKERAYIKRAVPIYRPDAVLVVFFCGNDIMENCPETFSQARSFALAYQSQVAPRKIAMFHRLLWMPGSRLNGLFAEAAAAWYARRLDWFVPGLSSGDLVSPELGVYAQPLDPLWSRAYACTDAQLKKLLKTASALDTPLWIASLAGPQVLGEARANVDWNRPGSWIAGWCASNGVPHCDLNPAIAAAGVRRAFWPHDGHLNQAGNAAVVDPLFKFVAAHAGKLSGE